MKLTFLGGADEVGASSTIIEVAGKKILVDAGIRISPRTSRGLKDDQLPDLQPISAMGGPDAIILTHAHTDHVGALPLVTQAYPDVPVYTTKATVDLVRVLLVDSGRLMESRYEAEGEIPLYDQHAIERLLDNFAVVDFRNAIKLGEGLQATFYPSGHIAGAGTVAFESSEGTLVMSGDLSLSPQRTVVSAETPRLKADALVLESTYGGRLHANRQAEERRLIEMLKAVTDNGGRVLIPAFAIGRAQEVIQILHTYRDQLDVPVYVDGMVRSICDAYSGFADILPKHTVKAAGDQPLFFRNNVHPVRSRKQREEIARKNDPCVVIASSGMLTGGASVLYAKHFASNPDNAILLTGYQDEESPGRFLQNVMQRKAAGETPVLKLGEERVSLRCKVDKYSLSAHADEGELVSIAEAMDAERIFLVHGDSEARESLWSELRQRKRMVSRPRVGQSKTIARRRRPVAGAVEDPDEPLDAKDLWDTLQSHHGEEFTARELAQVWYGDVERENEVIEALEEDSVYFSQDWRDRSRFTVKTNAQVNRVLTGRELMRAHPDLPGQLIVMRNSNGQPRLAIVEEITQDGFKGPMQGSRALNHPGHALLWPLGTWRGYDSAYGDTIKHQLNALLSDAEEIAEDVFPYAVRQRIAEQGDPFDPSSIISEDIEDPLDRQVALAAIVLTMAVDGATYEEGGLVTTRALVDGPMNQQDAREIALSSFPPEARLRKVGVKAHSQTLLLSFDFPDAAKRRYADIMDVITTETGWGVSVKPQTNQQALISLVSELLPGGARIVKGPSVYMEKREVTTDVEGMGDPAEVERAYKDTSGYRLRLAVRGGPATSSDAINGTFDAPPVAEPMEINAAYGLIRLALEPEGLQKVGLKHGEIVLSFISPQVGARHQEKISELARQTGYALRINPQPTQNLILDKARQLVRDAGWLVQKGPGLHTERGEVSVKLTEMPPESEIEQVQARLDQETGYRLIVK